MPDVWLDTVTPKISLVIYRLLPLLHQKGYTTLVTAKKQTQTTDLLDTLHVPYHKIGDYGYTLREKLKVEQDRTLGFLELFDKVGYPKVLWAHGDVSAIRTAFGLKIPIVYANDTVFATDVAKLVTPLVDYLVAPKCFGKSWTRYGITRDRIIHYDGLEELALQNMQFEQPMFLKELENRKPVILFRDAEYHASYCGKVQINTQELLEKLAQFGTVVVLPRYENEKNRYEGLSNVWLPPKTVLTAQLMPYISLTVGSGGSICRETALNGVPTINFHFWDAQARYLHRKGFPIRILRDTPSIVRMAKRILRKQKRVDTAAMLMKLESPLPKYISYIEKCLNAKSTERTQNKC
jgi:predicted glycosyltransferase